MRIFGEYILYLFGFHHLDFIIDINVYCIFYIFVDFHYFHFSWIFRELGIDDGYLNRK